MAKSRFHKISAWLFGILIILFCASILFMLIGRGLCVRNTKNYAEKQDELFLFDEIATVLADEDENRIYVCYNDASWVNVYDSEGIFLWAVSTPYLRNVYFEISDGCLIIYGTEGDCAYRYSAETGDFVDNPPLDSLELSYDWEKDIVPISEVEPGTLCYDAYQVYRVAEDGSLITIVDRPGWYVIFNPFFGLLIAFFSATCIGILILIRSISETHRVKRACRNTRLSKKAAVILAYFRVTSAVQIVYAVANVICGFYGGFLIIGIIPLMLHFIISNIVLYNVLDAASLTEYEDTLIHQWKVIEWATAFVAFLSVIPATGLAA